MSKGKIFSVKSSIESIDFVVSKNEFNYSGEIFYLELNKRMTGYKLRWERLWNINEEGLLNQFREWLKVTFKDKECKIVEKNYS